MSSRFLVVLDLNGTILHRLKNDGSLVALKRSNRDCGLTIKIHGRPVIERPGCTQFLSSLLSQADVAVWTSAQAKNAVPLVMLGFAGLLSKAYYGQKLPPKEYKVFLSFFKRDDMPSNLYGEHKLAFLWSQDQCDIVGKSPGGFGLHDFKPDFAKNLEKIWTAHPGVYGPSNTIMIDDSSKKIPCAQHANHICIPEFDVTRNPKSATVDETLPKLQEYLSTLIQAKPFDVRDYMRAHPFREFLKTESLAKSTA